MRTPFVFAIAFAVAIGAAAVGAVGQPAPSPTPAPAPTITVSTTVPADIMPDAPSASLSAAATFAWNEFFALNWTAQTSSTGGGTLRDTPDTSCHFGDPSCTTLSRPLVWQTFRGKVEIFPGNAMPPASYASPPPTAPANWSYGYDGGPSYVYRSQFGPSGKATPGPCPNQSPAATPWVNLDETDQIGLDTMYAGSAPSPVPNASPGTTNSQPQMIRFVAKANRTMYSYIQGNNFYTGAVAALPVPKQTDPPPAVPPYNGTSPAYVSFPNGTIETKSAWRPLNATEAGSGKFVMAPVRYYETTLTGFTAPKGTCWRQDTFGLVALHIIQKTKTAPYFIYATFEQSDNIKTQAGDSVEDVNGAPAPCPSGAAPPCPVTKLPPSTPQTVLQDITSPANPPIVSIPPQVNRIIGGVTVPPTAPPQPGAYCAAPGKRVYYLNTEGKAAVPSAGFICINRRDNAIPPAIVAANVTAHAALASYEQQNGGYHSPFEHYKLINVQSRPYDKATVGPYVQASGGPLPSTYSLANIVVETNRALQTFSGSLVGGGATGSNSDFAPLFNRPILGQTFKNVYWNKTVNNMGGCMGCHGTQGQQRGSDFSVIAFQGTVTRPEYPAPIVKGRGAKAIPRNRYLGTRPHYFLISH